MWWFIRLALILIGVVMATTYVVRCAKKSVDQQEERHAAASQ